MASYNLQFKSKLKSYFIQKIGSTDYKHGWMKSDCPLCNRELKFGINISRNRTNCFICGYNKPPLELLKELEGVNTDQEAMAILRSEVYNTHEFKEEKTELREYKQGFQLPEGFRLLRQGDSQLARSARSYVKGRGFDITTMSRKGWGYCSGNKEMFGYLIIPFYNNGKLVYYNARNFMSAGPRYNNPNIDNTGVGKSSIWYNRDALFMYRLVYITEGAINSETLGERGIASGGKHVSQYQINDVIKSPVERIVILLDPDAKDKAIDLALKLINFKKIKLVFLPDKEDPNSLGRTKTLRLVWKASYINYRELIEIKNSI